MTDLKYMDFMLGNDLRNELESRNDEGGKRDLESEGLPQNVNSTIGARILGH